MNKREQRAVEVDALAEVCEHAERAVVGAVDELVQQRDNVLQRLDRVDLLHDLEQRLKAFLPFVPLFCVPP